MGYSISDKSCFDWIIAITPIIISLGVAYIAYSQYKINRYKFRLELYNRRFTVYENSLSFVEDYYSKEKENHSKIKQEFIHSYRESMFLFGEDSDVYKILTELKDTLCFLNDFDNNYSDNDHNKDVYNKLCEIKDQKRIPILILKDLEQALISWLDFKKVQI